MRQFQTKGNPMAKDKNENNVRLQIPIHEEVAKELEKYAGKFDQSLSWMAREMLIDGARNEEGVINWLTFRMVGKMLGNKREKMQCKKLPDCVDGEIVRIQVNVSTKLSDRITELAKKNYRPVSNMASLLILRALDDEAWILNFVHSKFAAPIRAVLTPKKPKKKNRRVA